MNIYMEIICKYFLYTHLSTFQRKCSNITKTKKNNILFIIEYGILSNLTKFFLHHQNIDLVGFYGISTIVGYLMPNLVYSNI